MEVDEDIIEAIKTNTCFIRKKALDNETNCILETNKSLYKMGVIRYQNSLMVLKNTKTNNQIKGIFNDLITTDSFKLKS